MSTIIQPINAEELSAAEKKKAYMKAYMKAYNENKVNKERAKERYQNNKEKYKERYNANKEKYKERYNANKQHYAAQSKKRYEDNKRKWIEQHITYVNKRRQVDDLFRMKQSLRSSVYAAFQRIQMNKPTNTETLLGCSWQEAKEHFEKLFEPGMTWMNHGEWHIDHIVPIATAQTIEEVVKLNHISNLQPLWGADNLKKGSKVPAKLFLGSS